MYNAQHNLLPWSPDDFSLWYPEAFSLYLLVSNPLSPPHHSLPSKRHPHGSGNHSHHPAHFQTGCKKVYSLLSHQYSHSLPFIKYRFTIKTEPLEKSIPALKLIWTNFILQLLYGMKINVFFMHILIFMPLLLVSSTFWIHFFYLSENVHSYTLFFAYNLSSTTKTKK